MCCRQATASSSQRAPASKRGLDPPQICRERVPLLVLVLVLVAVVIAVHPAAAAAALILDERLERLVASTGHLRPVDELGGVQSAETRSEQVALHDAQVLEKSARKRRREDSHIATFPFYTTCTD